jgi:hypothetical protein
MMNLNITQELINLTPLILFGLLEEEMSIYFTLP